MGVSQNWLLYQTKSLQKELGFFLQNCGTAQFLKFGLFLHCKNELKRAQNVQNSEFAYYASKSGKCIKQTPTPPFWGDVGVKKWSQILDSVLCCITVRLTLLKVTPVGNCFCSGCCCLSWTGMPVRLLRMRRVYTAPAILLLAAIVVERPCNSKRLTIQ